MRIAAVLECEEAIGGGFVQAVNSIVQMAEVCQGRHDFCVFSASEANRRYLRRLGLQVFPYRMNPWDLWLMGSSGNQLARRLQGRLRRIAGMEAAMLAEGVDLVYFVSPTRRGLALQGLNYISTVWDNCHRDIRSSRKCVCTASFWTVRACTATPWPSRSSWCATPTIWSLGCPTGMASTVAA